MEATGVIFAALDCDADAIEAWNRWYDLEHLPPNLALDGVVCGRRYVAPAELHEARRAGADTPYGEGRSAFLTVYTLTGDPMRAFEAMTELREDLVKADRMFADEKKIVRDGDVFGLEYALGDPALKAPPGDVPFIGHTALVVVLRRGLEEGSDWFREARAPAVVGVKGVHATVLVRSLTRPELSLELTLVDSSPLEALKALRREAPEHPGGDLVAEAPFLLIDPLRYPWAEPMRRSWLPATVR